MDCCRFGCQGDDLERELSAAKDQMQMTKKANQAELRKAKATAAAGETEPEPNAKDESNL